MSAHRFFSDGRLISFGFVGAYFLCIALTMALFGLPLSTVLNGVGVPAMNPHLGDLRNVSAGIENQQAGRAVGDPNPFDPWKRPYIYPSFWLQARMIGFNSDTVIGFGIAIILLFYVSAALSLGKLTAVEGVFTGLFLISPALMTGVERGNIDLVLFPLLAAAVALRRNPAASGALIIIATMLKLQPAGALLAFFSPPWRKTLPWLAGILGLLALYVLIEWHELAVISAHTAHYAFYTFGSSVSGIWLEKICELNGQPRFFPPLALGTPVFLAVAFAAARLSPRLVPDQRWEWEIFSFRLGAGLFLALFGLGSSNDYGLLFFLFCLPLLFRLRREDGPIRRWALATLILSLAYVNWDFYSEEYMIRHMLLKQALGWGLMANVVGLVCAFRRWPAPWASKLGSER